MKPPIELREADKIMARQNHPEIKASGLGNSHGLAASSFCHSASNFRLSAREGNVLSGHLAILNLSPVSCATHCYPGYSTFITPNSAFKKSDPLAHKQHNSIPLLGRFESLGFFQCNPTPSKLVQADPGQSNLCNVFPSPPWVLRFLGPFPGQSSLIKVNQA